MRGAFLGASPGLFESAPPACGLALCVAPPPPARNLLAHAQRLIFLPSRLLAVDRCQQYSFYSFPYGPSRDVVPTGTWMNATCSLAMQARGQANRDHMAWTQLLEIFNLCRLLGHCRGRIAPCQGRLTRGLPPQTLFDRGCSTRAASWPGQSRFLESRLRRLVPCDQSSAAFVQYSLLRLRAKAEFGYEEGCSPTATS